MESLSYFIIRKIVIYFSQIKNKNFQNNLRDIIHQLYTQYGTNPISDSRININYSTEGLKKVIFHHLPTEMKGNIWRITKYMFCMSQQSQLS